MSTSRHAFMFNHRLLPRAILKGGAAAFDKLDPYEQRSDGGRTFNRDKAHAFCKALWDEAAQYIPAKERLPYPPLEFMSSDEHPSMKYISIINPTASRFTDMGLILIARRKMPGSNPGYFFIEQGVEKRRFMASYMPGKMGFMRVRGATLDPSMSGVPELLAWTDASLDGLNPLPSGLEGIDQLLPLRTPMPLPVEKSAAGKLLGCLAKLAVPALIVGGIAALVYLTEFDRLTYEADKLEVLKTQTIKPGKDFKVSFVPQRFGHARYELWAFVPQSDFKVDKSWFVIQCTDTDGTVLEKTFFEGNLDSLKNEGPSREQRKAWRESHMEQYRTNTSTDYLTADRYLGAHLGWWPSGDKPVKCEGRFELADDGVLEGKARKIKLTVRSNQTVKDIIGFPDLFNVSQPHWKPKPAVDQGKKKKKKKKPKKKK